MRSNTFITAATALLSGALASPINSGSKPTQSTAGYQAAERHIISSNELPHQVSTILRNSQEFMDVMDVPLSNLATKLDSVSYRLKRLGFDMWYGEGPKKLHVVAGGVDKPAVHEHTLGRRQQPDDNTGKLVPIAQLAEKIEKGINAVTDIILETECPRSLLMDEFNRCVAAQEEPLRRLRESYPDSLDWDGYENSGPQDSPPGGSSGGSSGGPQNGPPHGPSSNPPNGSPRGPPSSTTTTVMAPESTSSTTTRTSTVMGFHSTTTITASPSPTDTLSYYTTFTANSSDSSTAVVVGNATSILTSASTITSASVTVSRSTATATINSTSMYTSLATVTVNPSQTVTFTLTTETTIATTSTAEFDVTQTIDVTKTVDVTSTINVASVVYPSTATVYPTSSSTLSSPLSSSADDGTVTPVTSYRTVYLSTSNPPYLSGSRTAAVPSAQPESSSSQSTPTIYRTVYASRNSNRPFAYPTIASYSISMA